MISTPSEAPALIFDLDGTLIDSLPDLLSALNRMLDELGRRRLEHAEAVMMVGDGAPRLVERALAATEEGRGNGDAGIDHAAALARFQDIYRNAPAVMTKPWPGVIETLETLARQGRPMAVCTNKSQDPTERVLEALDMARYFSAVIGGDTHHGRKPDPGPLLAAIDALGHDPGSVVMVGDSENDVGAARNAGVPVIAVSFGYCRVPLDCLDADGLIDDFRDLPRALRRLIPQVGSV